MTTTNQAFIKAYRQDAPQPAPVAPASAGVARTAAAVVRASPDPAQATTEALPTTHERRPTVGGVARSGDRLQQGSGDRPQHVATEKRPLSSFIAGTGIARLSSEPADGDFFRPGTTIASFEWPAVCRALIQQCGRQLDEVSELLVEQAAASHSLIAVLGLFPASGATTIAACLAARLAGRGRRIVLVDGNFQKPRLASLLQAVPTAGWQDVLLRGAPLADAVVRATADRLDLLALGPKPPNDAVHMISGLQAVVTAGVLRHAYDLVLVDAGAFFDSASQAAVLELVRNMGIDAAVAVTGRQPGDPRDRDIVAEHLGRSGCEFLGTIENRLAIGQESRVKSREPEHSSGSRL